MVKEGGGGEGADGFFGRLCLCLCARACVRVRTLVRSRACLYERGLLFEREQVFVFVAALCVWALCAFGRFVRLGTLCVWALRVLVGGGARRGKTRPS